MLVKSALTVLLPAVTTRVGVLGDEKRRMRSVEFLLKIGL